LKHDADADLHKRQRHELAYPAVYKGARRVKQVETDQERAERDHHAHDDARDDPHQEDHD
jgi:hypothetical protein